MDEKMLAAFAANCEKNNAKFKDLIATFQLAVLGYELQEARCKEVYNLILSRNEFFAEREFSRKPLNVKHGDRILDEENTFLLSEKDFDRLQKLSAPILVERGICDERGYYLEDWLGMKVKARQELVDFIIDEIVPKSFNEEFSAYRHEYVFQEKLLNAFDIKAA